MFRKIIFTIAIIIQSTIIMAQQIPVGQCGIVYIYDAAGNRTRRLYYCNNGGSYPSIIITEPETQKNSAKSSKIIEKEKDPHIEFAQIDAIFPNPTSGKFAITFSKGLINATIVIIDANGKTVQRSKQTGNKLDFDIYNLPSGIYFAKIIDGNNTITKKIIKQ